MEEVEKKNIRDLAMQYLEIRVTEVALNEYRYKQQQQQYDHHQNHFRPPPPSRPYSNTEIKRIQNDYLFEVILQNTCKFLKLAAFVAEFFRKNPDLKREKPTLKEEITECVHHFQIYSAFNVYLDQVVNEMFSMEY
jgi:hypothetical protein